MGIQRSELGRLGAGDSHQPSNGERLQQNQRLRECTAVHQKAKVPSKTRAEARITNWRNHRGERSANMKNTSAASCRSV